MNRLASLYHWQTVARQELTGQLYRLRRKPAQTAISEPERLLFVLSGLIGDTVMSTPVLAQARRLWPNAHITVLGGRASSELLAGSPDIDAHKTAPAIPFTLTRRREIKDMKRWMLAQRFDMAIILLGDQFAALLASAGIPLRIGVEGHALAPCLTHTYEIGSPRTWGPAERLNALRCLGYEVDDTAPQLRVVDSARDAARQRLAAEGLAANAPYAVIHPFGSTPRQWWPIDRVEKVADWFRQTAGWRTVLLGGPETRSHVPAAVCEKVVDTTGRLTIQEMMAVIEGAEMVISTDSGPFHIAGALKRPLIGLFRAQRPEHASRYAQAQVVFGRNDICPSTCKWDACAANPCRQLEALSPDFLFDCIQQCDSHTGTQV